MNYFEKRHGAGIEKINIQSRMKTRRNKGRNKTRKGRKGRKTYKTRKYGKGYEFNKKPYDPKIQFDSVKFLEKYNKIRKNKEKQKLLNLYRIEHNKEQELLRLAGIEMNLEKKANENKARQEENNARRRNKEAKEEANSLARLRENNSNKLEISKKKEYISTVTRYHPDKFVKSESVYDTLKAEFTEFNNISFDDFLIMFNHDQLSDIYNDEFNTNEMILFYLNYFSGIYYETKHELYNSVYNIVNTYKEYIKLNRLGRIEKKLHQSRV